MAELKLWASDKVNLDYESFRHFAQMMVNRVIVGDLRYGKPVAEKRYLTRLKAELKRYGKTGNQEHLVNIANYCWLEKNWPEHKKAHHDDKVGSVTRGRKDEKA